MSTPEAIRGEELADLPLILQNLLDQIEALRTDGASNPQMAELEAEYHELRGR